MKKRQVILSVDMAKYLIGKGFSIVDLDLSKKDGKSTVFVFDYSEKLQNAMDYYFSMRDYMKSQHHAI